VPGVLTVEPLPERDHDGLGKRLACLGSQLPGELVCLVTLDAQRHGRSIDCIADFCHTAGGRRPVTVLLDANVLMAPGFGHLIGNLGRREKREEFFAAQAARNARVAQFVARAPDQPDLEHLADLDRRLRGLQSAERTRADRRQAFDAHRLELRHFEEHLHRDQLPDLAGLPLLRRSADRVLDYLAESEMELAGIRPGPLRRIRNYFRYGSVRALDPADTGVVLRLQLAYYHKRIAELEQEVGRIEDQLRRADFEQLSRQHKELSVQFLHAELAARYRESRGITYRADSYRRGMTFSDFIKDYPALLSTCHSLRASIADGYLLDYLIIDEASQVNLLLAGLAMSCARHVVVVGDQRQLPPIPIDAANEHAPPAPAYDCQRNLLASLSELYGASLTRTLLCEHYRCDPVIIGFCNKKFYGDELIPYTSSGAEQPMIVVRTVEGNHMRQHREGGRSNQRELDVIAEEVMAEYCPGFAVAAIGVTTPYRRQATKAADVLDQTEADTVHRFHGRQKQVVILSTVLDETWRGPSFRADDSLLYALLVCIPGTSPRPDRLPQSCVGADDLGAPLLRVRRIGKRDLVGGDSTYDRRTQCGCGGRFRHAACGADGRLQCSCRKLRGSWLVAAA
jgi:hypothetical protein